MVSLGGQGPAAEAKEEPTRRTSAIFLKADAVEPDESPLEEAAAGSRK